jgi:hypothetical protein
LLLTVCGLLTVPALGAPTAVASPGGATASAGWERVDSRAMAALVDTAGRTALTEEPSEGVPVAIQSAANGQYLAAEKFYAAPNTGLVRARSTVADIWETFDLSWDSTEEMVYLRSHANGLYVATELNYTGAAKGVLRARSATSSGSWERFYLWYSEERDQYSFQSVANGLFVAMEKNYTGTTQYALRARSAAATGSWEGFQIFSPVPSEPATR